MNFSTTDDLLRCQARALELMQAAHAVLDLAHQGALVPATDDEALMARLAAAFNRLEHAASVRLAHPQLFQD